MTLLRQATWAETGPYLWPVPNITGLLCALTLRGMLPKVFPALKLRVERKEILSLNIHCQPDPSPLWLFSPAATQPPRLALYLLLCRPLQSFYYQWFIPLFHISSVPTRLLVFSSATREQNSRTRFFVICVLNSTLSRHLLRHAILLPITLFNVLTRKYLKSCATLQDSYMKLGKIGFLMLQPLSTASLILPQAKHLITSCMGSKNASRTMCWCTLLFPCTP